MQRLLYITICLVLFSTYIRAVELPDIIGNNAVFQQNTDIKLWGWSKPDKEIKIIPTWNNKVFVTKSNNNGRWEILIPTPKASYTPYSITFDDGNKVTISNILIGEVWFCSGQSNMEMPLRGFWTQPIENANQTIAYSAKYPGIRVVTIPKTRADHPADKISCEWKESKPQNAPEFTAVGYHFAQSLSDILNVPVGIISCAWGGSKVEGWMSKELLNTYPEWNVDKNLNDTTIADWQKIMIMYNGMLHPLIGYTIKGFLWNQGEANVGMEGSYAKHLADMVKLWRNEWKQGDLPFYSVEIPGWSYGNPNAFNAALLREAQNNSIKLIPNSGIVCTSDLVYPYEVEDIHACKKKEIGERLAFMAANKTYGIKGIASDYPLFKSMEINGNTAILHFVNADDGFTPNRNIEGFEVAGSDKVFYPANATEIYETRDIKISCDKVDEIKAVRYCFKNFAIGKVHNLMGLPLIPFRTDNWND